MILGMRTFAVEVMKVSMVSCHYMNRPVRGADGTTTPRHRGRCRPCWPRNRLLSPTGWRPRHRRRSGGRSGPRNELCERRAAARELGGALELSGSPLADPKVARARTRADAAASPSSSRTAFVGTKVHSQFDPPSL